MINTVSLNENKLFKRLYYHGKSVISPILVLYYLPGIKGKNRLGITVSTKVGSAVIRNRVKRLIRENYRLLEPSLKTDYDIVIVARKAAAYSDFHKINAELEKLVKKAGLLL